MTRQFSLLLQRRFAPLFAAQFLGAFNDNFFKTILSVLVAYEVWRIGDAAPALLVSLAAGLFILPFVLFAPLAGQLADKYDKARIVCLVKAAEILLVGMIAFGAVIHSTVFMLGVLFLLGVQSAFFTPCKYALLPQHLPEGELIGGNALMNTGTFLAILCGTIFGSALAFSAPGPLLFFLFIAAIAGYGAARFIPDAPARTPDLHLKWNAPAEAARILRYARRQGRGIFAAMFGVAWFYFVGGLFLAQIPAFTQQVLGAPPGAVTFFMVVFSLGIALGGLLNNRLLRGRVDVRYAALMALGIGVFALDLFWAAFGFSAPPEGFDLRMFLSGFAGQRIVFDLFMLSACGGVYVVPLSSLIQLRVPASHSARVLSASGLMNALFILSSAVMAVVLLAAGAQIPHLFAASGALSFLVAVYLWRSFRA